MEALGDYNLFTRTGEPVLCEAAWLSSDADWRFVSAWESMSGESGIWDSVEYALIAG